MLAARLGGSLCVCVMQLAGLRIIKAKRPLTLPKREAALINKLQILHARFREFAYRFRRLLRIEVGPAAISPLSRCTFDFLAARIAKNASHFCLQFRRDVNREDNAGVPGIECRRGAVAGPPSLH